MRHTDGLIVPVHEEGALAWYASFSGREPDLSQKAQILVGAAVYAGHALFQELMDDKAPRSPLTARESECLRWAAEGKTDVEAGQIIGISSRTVRFHINNAKIKLGVATRIQAVAKRMSGAA
jgi:LuxR family transcriptional activator of bioluminescence operon/LuxR family quorum-sensing system transcriptional regulator CciR